MAKYEVICDDQARSDDYACNTCGGDIRGLKCCNPANCDIHKDGKLQTRPKPVN